MKLILAANKISTGLKPVNSKYFCLNKITRALKKILQFFNTAVIFFYNLD